LRPARRGSGLLRKPPAPDLTPRIETRISHLARKRWWSRTAGFFPDGLTIDSDGAACVRWRRLPGKMDRQWARGAGGGKCGCEIRGRANGLGAHLTGRLHVPCPLTHASQKALARLRRPVRCCAELCGAEQFVPFYAFLFIGRCPRRTLILELHTRGRTTAPKFRLMHLACWQNSFSKIVRACMPHRCRPRAEAVSHGVLSGTANDHWAMLTQRAAVPANRVSHAQDAPKHLRHDRALLPLRSENATPGVSPRAED
jgi:hypothetical protein